MRVTIILPDKDLEPLMQEHLLDGSKSVGDLILQAVRLQNAVNKEMQDSNDRGLLICRYAHNRYSTEAVIIPCKDHAKEMR